MPSRSAVAGRRLIRSRQAVTGLGLIVLLVVLAVAGPYLTRWRPGDVDLTAFREPPSAGHWLGTTQTGRDMYVVTLRGMRRSLVVALLAAVVSTGVAGIVGTVAGYLGGWTDRVLMWAVDLLLAFPPILVVAVMSPALRDANRLIFVLVLAAFMWMTTARVVRGMSISLREREYVLAARYLGAAPLTIIWRHIVPHLASLLIVDATLNVSAAVIGETSLSFFGLGVRPPDVSLGTIIADGASAAVTFPWLVLPPILVLVILVLGVNLAGDGLRDALDPASGRCGR